MRKLLITFLSFTLVLIFALNGCSCAATQPLAFEKAYSDKSGNYSETLEYSVSYQSTYKSISNITNVKDEAFEDCNFNGTYVVEFSNSHNVLPDGVKSNIVKPDYHSIKSILSLSFTLNQGTENEKTYNDQIVSEVYFLSEEFSFAPVYSKTTIKYTNFKLVEDEELSQTIYQYSTTYNKSKYKITKMVYQPEQQGNVKEDINLIDITNTDPENSDSPSYFDTNRLSPMSGNGKSYEYEFKRVIDNNQLLFAIRNSNLGEANLPTVSFSYGDAIDIIAEKTSQTTYQIPTLEYNGQTNTNLEIPVKNVAFSINTSKNRGTPKYMSIQRSAVGDEIKNNALMVEYAEPIVWGLSTIGALVYKLNKVTIN